MRVTPEVIEAIEVAIKERGVRKSELARRIGLGPSWVTELLRGQLKTLRQSHRRIIESALRLDLLSIEAEVIAREGRTFSPLALRVAALVDDNLLAREMGEIMLKLFDEPTYEKKSPSDPT